MSVTYRLTAATPTSVGWYDPSEIDTRFYIRPASLKGVWRWWTRAIVGGILYEAGLLRCDKYGNCKARIPVLSDRGEYDMSSVIGLLGLGAGGDDAGSSRYQILLRVERPPRPCDTYSLQNLQRVKLLSFGSRQVKYFIGGTFKLILRGMMLKPRDVRQLREIDIDLAKKLLLTSLTLGGVGKGSRRGLGSLDVTSSAYERYKLKDLLEDVRGRLAKHLGINLKATTSSDMPPVTLISKNNTSIFEIRCQDTSRRGPCQLSLSFQEIHNFFYRAHRQRRLGSDPFYSNLIGWVLGLPRANKYGEGYLSKANRRASPIIIAHHIDHVVDDRGERTYLTVIKSADWPSTVRWVGATTREISIMKLDIEVAIDIALDALRTYLQGMGCTMTRVWP